MREVLDQLEGLIQFQGLNFRSTVINCNHCGWSGTGGALEVPGLAASGEPVVYACPACMEAVAVHNGLSDQEVMQEMDKIRQILAEELAGNLGHTEEWNAHPQPDFAAIRAQLPTRVTPPLTAQTGEADAAPVECAADHRRTDESALPELDFEEIRARLGATA